MTTLTGSGAGPTVPPVLGDRAERRRRPSGEPPALPRHIAPSTIGYAVAVAATMVLETAFALDWARRGLTRADDAVVRAAAHLRAGWLDATARALIEATSPLVVRIAAWATLGVLLVMRRVRHLITYLAVLLVVVSGTTLLADAIGRMRPTGVHIAGPWEGYAHPSLPVAGLCTVLVGASYGLVPGGRARRRVSAAAAGLVLAVALSRVLLGVDHPTDVLAAAGFGWALPVVVFRVAVPEAVFPVRYRRERRAHLELTDERRRAITVALADQLGVHAESIERFGLGGSAGSTPLRIVARTPDGAGRALFGKLYAVEHLRADRSYKLARMVLYGRLEDEKPFATVRRLAEYEDHMLRLLRDQGVPVPRPHGFVEITPEREYVVVMGFVDGGTELCSAPVGEAVLDSGLHVVRRLWDAGVAHRDIKPSNLLVAGEEVVLIDVAFAAARPTPWRQAVDLANMCLTLALCSSARAVHERARTLFAPADLAEAFAACRGVTVPTQLRSRLRAHDGDLVAEFRALVPARRPVAVQVWSVRRVLVSLLLLLGAAATVVLVWFYASVVGWR